MIPIWMVRREPTFRDEYRLAFSSEGIHFHTAQIDSHLKWGMYACALVDERSYLFYDSARQFPIISKHVFESAEQRQAFEQLLTAHFPNIVRRGA